MKYISITRTVNNDPSASTLVMEEGRLVVMGNLPHGAEITMDKENAETLAAWLKKTYGV